MEMMKEVYYALLSLCLVILLIRYEKLPQYCRWFIPLIFIGLLIEIVKDKFPFYRHVIHKLYQPIEFLLLLYFYKEFLQKAWHKRLMVGFFIFYLLACGTYYFLTKTITVKVFVDVSLQSFLVCILVCIFFFELRDIKQNLNLMTYGAFWLNAVHLIFYGCSFFAYALYKTLPKPTSKNSLENITPHVNITSDVNMLEVLPHYLNLFLYAAYFFIFVYSSKRLSNEVQR